MDPTLPPIQQSPSFIPIVVMIGSVIILIIYLICSAWKELKDRVTELENKNNPVKVTDQKEAAEAKP